MTVRQTAANAVQAAFYTTLNGNVGAPVYDEPPETADLPYVTIGEATTTHDNRFGLTARQVVANVHVWTRSGGDSAVAGFLEGNTIAAAVDSLLDGQPLTLTGWGAVACNLEQSQTLRDPDGITRHVVLTYRVFVEAA